MTQDAVIQEFGLALRPVTVSDARWLIDQRRHPRATPFLGPTSPSLEEQLLWLKEQQERSGDWYWICVNRRGARLAAIAVYDVSGHQAQWGRFVVRPGSKAAPGCLLLGLRMAFERLCLNKVYSKTVCQNTRALSFYERAQMRRAPEWDDRVTLHGAVTHRLGHQIDRATWGDVRHALGAAAAAKEAEVSADGASDDA